MSAKPKFITFSTLDSANQNSGFIQANTLILSLINSLEGTVLAERHLLIHLYMQSCLSRHRFKNSSLPRTNKSTRKLAQELNLSLGYVSKLKASLVDKGYLDIEDESKSQGSTLVLYLPLKGFKAIQDKRFKQQAINKKIAKQNEEKRIESNKTKPGDVLDMQSELVCKIASLNKERIDLTQKLPLFPVGSNELKQANSKMRVLRYQIGQLNSKLAFLQKEGVRKRISVVEQECHDAQKEAEMGGLPKENKAAFITAEHTRTIFEGLKKLGVSPPAEYTKQILWSIRYGYYAQEGYSVKHAINNALKRIAENRFFVNSDYDPKKIEGLFVFHLKNLKKSQLTPLKFARR